MRSNKPAPHKRTHAVPLTATPCQTPADAPTIPLEPNHKPREHQMAADQDPIGGMSVKKPASPQDISFAVMMGNDEWLTHMIDTGKIGKNTIDKAIEQFGAAMGKEKVGKLEALSENAKDKGSGLGGRKSKPKPTKMGDEGEAIVSWLNDEPHVKIPMDLYVKDWGITKPIKKPGDTKGRSKYKIKYTILPDGPKIEQTEQDPE